MADDDCVECREAAEKTERGEHGDASGFVKGCASQYAEVERCMKAHNGNVADCNAEWTAFRRCFDSRRSA
eukprot:CAMPEP_0118886848 /NCGR_PEP_ID=MMETSP1163-20130328/24785_1 /TAXON_ID=124430 /ORGANISM="Phaeomonas parva, Strain CCMP2877" /LENGTH=69 /DNA_ID=CAMNT_0006825167 /DNA_START=245 /DNA_END=454 /DNA_ORIENTATION=+